MSAGAENGYVYAGDSNSYRVTRGTIIPGDVIQSYFGVNREPFEALVLGVHRYETGAIAYRFRFASNPRGVDWKGFLSAEEAETVEILRHDDSADFSGRTLLP